LLLLLVCQQVGLACAQQYNSCVRLLLLLQLLQLLLLAGQDLL
jgi:hypothetical protein